MAFRHFTLCCIYPIACWTRQLYFFVFFFVFSPTQFFGPKAEHGEHLAPEGLELREGLSRRETSAEGSQKSSARRSE